MRSDGKSHTASFISANVSMLNSIEEYIRQEYEVSACNRILQKTEFIPATTGWHGHGGDSDDEEAYTKSTYEMRITCCDPLSEFVEKKAPEVSSADTLLFNLKKILQIQKEVLISLYPERKNVVCSRKIDVFTNLNDFKECIPLLKKQFPNFVLENIEDGAVSYKLALM